MFIISLMEIPKKIHGEFSWPPGNVDVAFICICAYAVDELFSNNDN